MAHNLNKMGSNSCGESGEIALIQEEEKVVDAILLNMSTKPRVPDNFNNLPTKARLKALKQLAHDGERGEQYIGSFQYRLNSQTNFDSHKLRPLVQIMDTARMIVYAPQPIKCVEAVFVALYLSAGLRDVERVPLGFKTELHGQVYQHIVLLVQHGGRWGAFGISRCPDLMNKDFVFDCMSSVIENFKTAYKSQGHILLKIRVGLPVEHNITSPNFVCWRHLNLNLKYTSWAECINAIDKHAAKAKRLWDLWVLSEKGDDPCKPSALRKAPLDNKVLPPNDNAKKKKKKKKRLASRDATPTKVKPSLVTCSTICSRETSSSSRASSSEAADSSSISRSKHRITSKAHAAASSPRSKSIETTVVAASPASVGNSTFRVSKTNNKNNGASLETTREVARGTTLMRVAVPASTVGVMNDQVLAVSRGILKTKYFSGTPARNAGNFVSSTSSKSASGSHPKTRVDPLFSRIPVRISYQTLDAGFLLPRSSRVSRVG